MEMAFEWIQESLGKLQVWQVELVSIPIHHCPLLHHLHFMTCMKRKSQEEEEDDDEDQEDEDEQVYI